jgi:hypothetical protein
MPKNPYHIVAEAIRVEYIKDTDEVYLVFEVVDEDFKKSIKKDWTQDIELKIIDRKLILSEE